MPIQFENLSHPSRAATVTPNDSTDLTTEGILYIGTEGDVEVVTAGGDTVTFVAVTAGSFLPVLVSRVRASNTTADDIIVLF